MKNNVVYDSAQGSSWLLEQIIGNISGITIDQESVRYIGADAATSTFSSVDFGHNATLAGSGILLTSGDGTPALNNTESEYSVVLNEPGDPELDQLAQDAFAFAGTTNDASILEFSFSVDDPGVQSISFDLLFGSEEFPDFIDSPFVDIAAVIVNGQNHAYLDGDPNKPLSIVGATVSDGRFIDNTQNDLPIEYNGMTPRLTVTVPLEADVDTYQVRLGVADTGDWILDSGLFVSNFQTLTTGFGGTYVNVQAGDDGEELVAAGPNTATLFIGGAGNDTMTGSLASDVYDLSKGGQNTVQGSMAQLDQDTILGFTVEDSLKFLDVQFGLEDLTVTMGSAILEVDTDGDGQADSTVTLEGDFSQAQFQVVQEGGNSVITFEQSQPDNGESPQPGGGGSAEVSQEQAQHVALLYEAALDRIPDLDGLNYWLDRVEEGMHNIEIAGYFLASDEFQARFDVNSDEEYIDRLYANALGRDPDDEGRAYWQTQAENGLGRDEMLHYFAISEESIDNADWLVGLTPTDNGWVV